MKRIAVLLALCASFMLTACGGDRDEILEVTTEPMAAVSALNVLLRKHQVVAVSELHYNQEVWDVVDGLLQSKEFLSGRVDLAFEGGNSALQPLVDDFVNGGATTEAQVKRIWRDNTQVNTTYDAPVYLRMINRVRAINMTRPHSRRLRVLLLDPPIDWASVQGMQDYLPKLLDREPSMVRVIERETYAKGGKLLFVAGGPHVERSPASSPVKSALTQLEQAHPGTTFNVAFYSGFGVEPSRLGSLEATFDSWPRPGIAVLKGTTLGNQPAGINTVAKAPDGSLIDLYPGIQLQQTFDAILFAGRRGELRTSSPSEGVCTGRQEDEEWKSTLLSRQELVNVPAPLRTTVQKICAPLPRFYFDQEIFR
jgi:hypothetical protein